MLTEEDLVARKQRGWYGNVDSKYLDVIERGLEMDKKKWE
jgi:hypothetical protein